MLKRLLSRGWRALPRRARLWSVRLTQPRFAVTAGAVVVDARGRVLLLNHVFRKGSGWGIPGGFLHPGEQPDEALRRELREEIGLELTTLKVAFARTFKRPQQVEIIYLARAAHELVEARSLEVESAEWFELERLPLNLAGSQRRLIEQALETDGKFSEPR